MYLDLLFIISQVVHNPCKYLGPTNFLSTIFFSKAKVLLSLPASSYFLN